MRLPLLFAPRGDKAIDAADAGLAINQNFGSPSGGCEVMPILFFGRFEQAKSDILQSIRLSRARPAQGNLDQVFGWAMRNFGLGKFRTPLSRTTTRQSILACKNNMWPYASLAAANALAGKMDDARERPGGSPPA